MIQAGLPLSEEEKRLVAEAMQNMQTRIEQIRINNAQAISRLRQDTQTAFFDMEQRIERCLAAERMRTERVIDTKLEAIDTKLDTKLKKLSRSDVATVPSPSRSPGQSSTASNVQDSSSVFAKAL